MHVALELGRTPARVVAEIEHHFAGAGNHVVGACAGMDVGYLEARRREQTVAFARKTFVPAPRAEFGQGRHRLMDRIARLFRIGDMPLDAAHRQRAGQGAAPPDAQQVAQSLLGRRFAGEAVVDVLAAGTEMFDDAAHAIDGVALFVRGQQQGNRAPVMRMPRNELLQRQHECGHAALHVGGTASVQLPVADGRHEGIAGPGLDRAGRHDVGMTEEHEDRRTTAVTGPEILHGTERQMLDGETRLAQAFGDQVLATGIVRRHRWARDQILCQFDYIVHDGSMMPLTPTLSPRAGRGSQSLLDILHAESIDAPHPNPLPRRGEGAISRSRNAVCRHCR